MLYHYDKAIWSLFGRSALRERQISVKRVKNPCFVILKPKAIRVWLVLYSLPTTQVHLSHKSDCLYFRISNCNTVRSEFRLWRKSAEKTSLRLSVYNRVCWRTLTLLPHRARLISDCSPPRPYHRKRKQIWRHLANEIRNPINGLYNSTRRQYRYDYVHATLLVVNLWT